MFLTSQQVVHTEGNCVTVETVCCVIIFTTQNVLPLPIFFSQQIHVKTEMDLNLGSSKLQQLKPDTLLGSATNDLFVFFKIDIYCRSWPLSRCFESILLPLFSGVGLMASAISYTVNRNILGLKYNLGLMVGTYGKCIYNATKSLKLTHYEIHFKYVKLYLV